MDHASGCNGIAPDAHGRGFGKLSRSGRRGALTSVELQADKYATGIPAGLSPPVNPLQFLYLSTDVETRFINLLDPAPKTRRISDVPHIHRPSTLADWLKADTLNEWVKRLHAQRVAGCTPRRMTHGRRHSAPGSRLCHPQLLLYAYGRPATSSNPEATIPFSGLADARASLRVKLDQMRDVHVVQPRGLTKYR